MERFNNDVCNDNDSNVDANHRDNTNDDNDNSNDDDDDNGTTTTDDDYNDHNSNKLDGNGDDDGDGKCGNNDNDENDNDDDYDDDRDCSDGDGDNDDDDDRCSWDMNLASFLCVYQRRRVSYSARSFHTMCWVYLSVCTICVNFDVYRVAKNEPYAFPVSNSKSTSRAVSIATAVQGVVRVMFQKSGRALAYRSRGISKPRGHSVALYVF